MASVLTGMRGGGVGCVIVPPLLSRCSLRSRSKAQAGAHVAARGGDTGFCGYSHYCGIRRDTKIALQTKLGVVHSGLSDDGVGFAPYAARRATNGRGPGGR